VLDAKTTADRLRQARQNGGGKQRASTSLQFEDFYAYMLEHKYIFVPAGQIWPAKSVDARLPPVNDVKASAWLDQSLVNARRTSLRRRSRVREIRMPDGFDAEAPQAAADRVAERDALERAFGGLTIEQRTILVLHHLERRPLSAIAVALAIPVGTAGSRLHAARTALERLLETER
jgi:RNA polymerase sigma factor (sigma-70 family)